MPLFTISQGYKGSPSSLPSSRGAKFMDPPQWNCPCPRGKNWISIKFCETSLPLGITRQESKKEIVRDSFLNPTGVVNRARMFTTRLFQWVGWVFYPLRKKETSEKRAFARTLPKECYGHNLGKHFWEDTGADWCLACPSGGAPRLGHYFPCRVVRVSECSTFGPVSPRIYIHIYLHVKTN